MSKTATLYTLETLPQGTELKLREFMDAVGNTSPNILETMTGIPALKWWGWRSNYRQGKMTIDKQLEIADALGCDTSQPNVIYKS